MKRKIVVSVLITFIAAANVCLAQTGSFLKLDDLIEEALKNNKDIESAHRQLEAARFRIPQSSALPDPMVGYSIMGPDLETRLGPQEEIYEFEQVIPFPGKLIEKRNTAKAEAEEKEAQLRLAEKEVVLNTAETYYDLYAVNKTLQVTEEIYELLKKFESIAQARYASEQSEQREVAKAQTEVSETLQKIFMLRQQKDTLLALLNSLLNNSVDLQQGNIPDPELPELAFTLDELILKADNNRPELLEAKAALKKEKYANRLAKYENAPDLSVGFQYIRIGEGMTTEPDDGKDAWMIPLKITIPLWQNRIGSGIQESNRNLKSIEAQLKQEENVSQYTIKNAFYRFTSACKIFELYRNALIPQAELAFRSDQAGYEAGKTDILNLLDSEKVYFNAKVAYYQALSDALKNSSLLERATGISLRGGYK
ncbi:MAG: hypothetical protein A2Z88_09580 [Omnitrophica WOR_2 bacterium GWA2_47_8]|nr:MAG: hypothetical protein A2Z88_09580 [Omnitrophica WOR_2 bacterium GWA2_47_8]